MPQKNSKTRKLKALAPRRSRAVIVTLIVLSLLASWTLLAYSGALDPLLTQKNKTSGTMSIQSFNSNSPSKEYIYAGARLVATEEPQSCAPVLTPTYQSFPATPNPSNGSVGIAIALGCNWTATTTAAWITFPFGGSGTGSGSLAYSVAQNTVTSTRSGTINVSGAGGTASFTVYQGVEFTDVPTTHPFYSFIGRLSARGVTAGCGTNPPVFCPDQEVPHDQMSIFVLRAKGEPTPQTPPFQRFADVPPSYWAYAFIDRIAALNIWNGCPNGLIAQPNCCPGSLVTREQMAAMMIRGIGEFNPPTPPTQRFNDVAPSNQFYNYIDRMAVLGITAGCSVSPPLYCPTSSVTRGQMAVFLVRAFNL